MARLFHPRGFKTLGAGLAAAGLLAMGGVCMGLRFAPVLLEQRDLTAMTAAGFILSKGAAQVLRGNADTEHMGDPLLSSLSSELPSQPAEGASSQPVSAASSFAPVSSAASSQTTFTGTPYPIEEVQITQGNVNWKNFSVRNSNQHHTVDIEKILSEQPDVHIKKDGTPQVLLYHTHSSEAYLKEESDTYYSDMPTRSQDETENIMSVGEVIASKLEAAGIGVIHDKTYHDYPAYNGSYTRSAETIRKNLEKYPSIQVTIDIHRDAISGQNGSRKKPTAVVNGKKAAQVMILNGCDDDGTLGYPDWEQNLRFSMRLQQACEAYEDHFARPLTFSPTKYNQNLTHGSILVEFGTEVNTLDEAKYSAELFADALISVLHSLS